MNTTVTKKQAEILSKLSREEFNILIPNAPKSFYEVVKALARGDRVILGREVSEVNPLGEYVVARKDDNPMRPCKKCSGKHGK